MKINGFDIMNAVGDIEPALVERAREERCAGSRLPVIGAFAAMLALTCGLALAARHGAVKKNTENSMGNITVSETEKTPDEGKASYIGFIKYGNRIYIYHETCRDARELVGEYLGRIENKVAPGTPLDECPDMSGYEEGDICAVSGFDPAYLICRAEGGTVSVYINRETEGVTCGRDVIETRFHASERLTSLIYEGTESLFNGYDERYLLDPDCGDLVLDMLKALDGGEWFSLDPEDTEEYLRVWNSDQWRLELSLGRISIGITLFENGFACVHEYSSAMLIRFDPEEIKPFTDLLANGEHGTPVESTDCIRALRPEALYDEPNFGVYFPREIPAGYGIDHVYIHYPVNEDTGEIVPGRPDRLSAEYRGTDDFEKMFSITVGRMESLEDYLNDLSGIAPEYRCEAPLDELTADTVRVEIADNGDRFIEVSAYYGDILITVRSWSLTPEEAVALIRLCFGR